MTDIETGREPLAPGLNQSTTDVGAIALAASSSETERPNVKFDSVKAQRAYYKRNRNAISKQFVAERASVEKTRTEFLKKYSVNEKMEAQGKGFPRYDQLELTRMSSYYDRIRDKEILAGEIEKEKQAALIRIAQGGYKAPSELLLVPSRINPYETTVYRAIPAGETEVWHDDVVQIWPMSHSRIYIDHKIGDPGISTDQHDYHEDCLGSDGKIYQKWHTWYPNSGMNKTEITNQDRNSTDNNIPKLIEVIETLAAAFPLPDAKTAQ